MKQLERKLLTVETEVKTLKWWSYYDLTSTSQRPLMRMNELVYLEITLFWSIALHSCPYNVIRDPTYNVTNCFFVHWSNSKTPL